MYFCSVTMFIFFLLGGRYLEMNARRRRSVSPRRSPSFASFAQRFPGFPGERATEQCVVWLTCGTGDSWFRSGRHHRAGRRPGVVEG